MTEEIFDEEELEEEANYKETLKAIETQAKRYKSLFGEFPSNELSHAGIHDKICEEMKRRDLRPYKL